MSQQTTDRTERKRPVISTQKLRTSLRNIQTTNLDKFGILPTVVITKKKRRRLLPARAIE